MAQQREKRVFVAGHRDMVSAAIRRRLENYTDSEIITATRKELDLIDQSAVRNWLDRQKADEIYIAAAKVGGILANNSYPADFIYGNLMIEANLIQAAHEVGIQKLLFLGSSCRYPKYAEQPIEDDALLTGNLEPTNEPYAVAKIAGIKLCESYNSPYGRDYRSAMPTNLYGPNDNFHPEHSHVIPGLVRRFHEAKQRGDSQVTVWGSGKPRREFLHVDDLASAAVYLTDLDSDTYWSIVEPMLSHTNVGTGVDCTIRELAETVAWVTGYQGDLVFDTTKPDGTPRKLLEVEKLSRLGWTASIGLEEGLQGTHQWLLRHEAVPRT